MKKLLTVIVSSSLLFTSCDYLQGYIKGASASAEDSLAAKDDYIAARDMSITEANAYSDLFLDSASVEQYIQQQQLPEQMARRVRSFYNSRNYQAAWFTSQGFTEQGRSFWSTADERADSLQLKQDTRVRIDSLMEEDSLRVAASDSLFIQTELALTREFVHAAKSEWAPEDIHFFFLPARKMNALQLADSLLNTSDDSVFAQNNPVYHGLKKELQRYYTLTKDSAWQPISGNVQGLKKGGSSPVVSALKRRLAATGDWPSADTSMLFSDSLHTALVTYQKRNGLDSNGVVTDSLLTLLNVSPQDRVEQILVNMNRALWMPVTDSGRRIEVNVPAYMLYVYGVNDSAGNKLQMPVVVGKEGTHTLMLNGQLNEIVFNPYWNIPASIVETEIMPAMKADPNYLKKNNMEIVSSNDSIPQVRQLPGEQNALGKVKFLFPNAYDIYLHDSPAKELFNKQDRAFSHGCIRVADANKLAQLLLQNQDGWSAEKINEAMNNGKEQKVTLKNPVPVYVNYYTAWVDEAGNVRYYQDIYGHDARTRSLMFSNTGA